MPLTRDEYQGYDFHHRLSRFTMLDGDVKIDCEVTWRALDRLDNVPNTLSAERDEQFERHRPRIENVAQRVFFARRPHTNDPISLTEASFQQ